MMMMMMTMTWCMIFVSSPNKCKNRTLDHPATPPCAASPGVESSRCWAKQHVAKWCKMWISVAVCTACWTCLKMHACIIMYIYIHIYVYTCAFATCFNIISHTCPDCNKPTQVKVGHDTNTFRCYIGRWIISASTCHRPVQASPALCRHPHADVSRDPAGTRSAKAHDQCCK